MVRLKHTTRFMLRGNTRRVALHDVKVGKKNSLPYLQKGSAERKSTADAYRKYRRETGNRGVKAYVGGLTGETKGKFKHSWRKSGAEPALWSR